MMMWRLAFFVLCLPGLASAETFTWGCNPEADMKEYRGERSDNGGATWGVLFKKDHVPGCTELSYQSTAYVKPGDKLGRLFACDKTGQCSAPSTPPVSYKIATPIIGNPGGQTETPLPPSPFAGAVTPPPPVVVPPPPPVVKPGDVAGIAGGSITQDSAIISGTVPAGAKINLRYMKAPLSWGAATSAAWTLSGVDALELGGIETTAVLSRLMDVQAYVDYTPAASASGGCRMMLCGVGR